MILTMDSLEFLNSKSPTSVDIVFCDPPYGLGSDVIIREDGKPDYRKAADFMSKWDMPTGDYWAEWFKAAAACLKHGGRVIMYGMDRQLMLFKYYAVAAGLVEQQSLYWYFISSFPKTVDLSKSIDAHFGAEREILGVTDAGCGGLAMKNTVPNEDSVFTRCVNRKSYVTAPSTEMAKKYDGYKYSIAPLKQACETIMVFMKPHKNAGCLKETLALEGGDNTVCCSALAIDSNRVDYISEQDKAKGQGTNKSPSKGFQFYSGSDTPDRFDISDRTWLKGRFPAQIYVDGGAADALDFQSGMLQNNSEMGGCSKILHKCVYDTDPYDIFIYQPKTSVKERSLGLPSKNPHPTLKPIDLNFKIMKLFKTPAEQFALYPFAGSGSEVIGGIKAGFLSWEGCEINPEFAKIANMRIKYWYNSMQQTQLKETEDEG